MSTLRLLIKPTLFTAGFCGTCFCGAAIYQYETNPSKAKQYTSHIRQMAMFRVNQDKNLLKAKFFELRKKFNEWNNQLKTGERIAYVTISINLAVLLCWKSNKFRPIANRFFNSKFIPDEERKVRLLPMLLSCFSHNSIAHLSINMYCLYSFSNFLTNLMGAEQCVALYLSSGVVSSLTSLAVRILSKNPTGSIGASGALFGMVAYFCTKMPEATLLLFFVPLPAGVILKSAMAVDLIGLILKFRFIDHAAHLGGALFGVWYATYGERIYYQHKRTILKHYLDYKKMLKGDGGYTSSLPRDRVSD